MTATTVTDWDVEHEQAAEQARQQILAGLLGDSGDLLGAVAAERARYDLMADAFDQATRLIAAERLEHQRDNEYWSNTCEDLKTQLKAAKARANLAPLGQQVRSAIRTGAAIGIRPAAYNPAADETAGSKRHDDGAGE